VHNSAKCAICNNSHRDNTLLVVHRDVDLEAFEKASVYNGYYFVLGGSIPVLDTQPERFIRIKELHKRITELQPSEVTLAFHLNPEGEYTTDYISKNISTHFPLITVTTLGRGLSTGSEIEYADKDTIKHAFLNRK
jgi:recombination protein RecR